MGEPSETGDEHKPKNVVHYRSPRAIEEYSQYLGMVLFLCSWAMLFAGFFMAYALIRSRAPAWPPHDQPRPPRILGALNTGVIALASVAVWQAVQALRQGQRARAVPRMVMGLGLGAMFLAIQLAAWTQMAEQGLTLASGPYGSVVIGLTAFHALHVLVGLGGLAWCTWHAWRGLYNPGHLAPVKLWGLYWHGVTGVWLVTFLAVYLA